MFLPLWLTGHFTLIRNLRRLMIYLLHIFRFDRIRQTVAHLISKTRPRFPFCADSSFLSMRSLRGEKPTEKVVTNPAKITSLHFVVPEEFRSPY